MKKHFLLLLMAFFSLAGWAEDLTSAFVAVGDIEYGTAQTGAPFVVWEGETLTEDRHYTVGGYYTRSGEEGNYTYSPIEGTLATQPIGTYYLKISGIPANGFNGDAYGPFQIIKKQLEIDFNAVNKTYGDDYQAPTFAVTYKTGGAEVSNAILTSLQITPLIKDGENTITVTATTDAKAYDFGFTYNEDGDYELTRKDNDADQYVISAKSITAQDMTVQMGEAGTYTYTGNAITGLPTFTVKDGETPVTTFDVKWFAAELSNDPETSDEAAVVPTNAGTYYARVTGTGNYGGKTFDNTNWKVTVNPVALTVLVNPKSKTYNGVAYTTADVEYTFGGLVDADQGKVDLTTLTPTKDGGQWDDFKNYKEGGYTIGVNVEVAKIGTGEAAINLSTNYTVTPVSSNWTINKIPGLTITAANQSIGYGEDIPATSTITAAAEKLVATEKATIEALYTAPKAEGAVNNVYGTQPDIYTPTLGDGDASVLDNYETPTLVAGSLSVGGQNAAIMPIVASVIYDGEAHAATGYSANSGAYILTAWDAETETGDVDVSSISYQYKKLGADGITWGDWSTTEIPQGVGVYRAQVVKNSVAGKNSFADADIARPEVQFEIQARPITITVTGATLHKGDKEANLEGHTLYTKEGSYVEGENVVLKPVFVTPTAEGLTLDEDTKKVTTNPTVDPIAGAVVMTDDVEGDNDNANYAFTFVAGPLTIAASELVLDPTDEDLATKIEEAAATGEKYAVTFKNLKMTINEWYAMVLPFDIDPLEMVNEFDRYVIFNELNKDMTTDQEIKFTLNLKPILAGTPFLIKFAPKADDAPDAVVDWSVGDIAFDTKNINATITDVENGYIKFTGSYTSEHLQGLKDSNGGEKVWWLGNSALGKKNTWLKPKGNPRDTKPMEAYLTAAGKDWTTYAPNFTVEDFDGQTTAIKSLSVDQINNLNTDGLYNLQGVKIQGAAKKGIYIQNGKKIVVK